jgi:uncharacterized protein (DUF1697 family)
MAQNVALLRGINVGGKNMIAMAKLRECFEANGYLNVATYIQSGNVLFETKGAASAALATKIEAMLSAAFRYRASVVVRTHKQMQAIVEGAPRGFGARPDQYRYDVLYLKSPLTAAAALKSVPAKPGVDQVQAGTGVLYFSRLADQAAQSHLSRLVSLPIYQNMTIRNWNTTTKLLEIMDRSKE